MGLCSQKCYTIYSRLSFLRKWNNKRSKRLSPLFIFNPFHQIEIYWILYFAIKIPTWSHCSARYWYSPAFLTGSQEVQLHDGTLEPLLLPPSPIGHSSSELEVKQEVKQWPQNTLTQTTQIVDWHHLEGVLFFCFFFRGTVRTQILLLLLLLSLFLLLLLLLLLHLAEAPPLPVTLYPVPGWILVCQGACGRGQECLCKTPKSPHYCLQKLAVFWSRNDMMKWNVYRIM